MRVPLSWLQEYCDPPIGIEAIEERLTMTGTKVEAIHRHGVGAPERFVLGRVRTCEPHPNADRLRVCTVDVGGAGETGDRPTHELTIVCGAPNVAAGQTVAVALPGAIMPGGAKIERAKLRGVASEGMICSERELEIGPGEEGIMVLDGAALDADRSKIDGISDRPAPGTLLADVLPIAETVIELEVTPNRPDCLGVYGVARELHAATGAPLAPAPWSEDPGSLGDLPDGLAAVDVQCPPELCPRFTARVFEDVTVAPSPPWLAARLSAAGQRPINNVVDITNYAMLLTGQPLHAFDLDRVAGHTLTVRLARAGEPVETLDGQTRALDGQMVLIEDADGPTAIAGVMGGARSEVAPETTRVLLEVATWNGPNIHRTSWALGLRSEASARFEKGLQPEQCLHAQAVASRLLIEVCGARLAPGTIDLAGAGPPPRVLRLRERRVETILGVPVAPARQREIMAALDFAAAPAGDGLDVTVPPLRRGDVTREIDLIEEVARIDGLERLPATLPARRGAAGRLTHAQRVRRAAEDALAGRGLREIVGWSFADPALLDRLLLPAEHPLRRVVRIENPLSEDQSILRPTLLGSLLDAARHNVARNGPDVAIFESGGVYRAWAEPEPARAPDPDGEAARERPADEHHGLGALLTGALAPPSWRDGTDGGAAPPRADFFAAKGLLEALLESLHVRWSVRPAPAGAWPFLHPGRAAEVLAQPPRTDDPLDGRPPTGGGEPTGGAEPTAGAEPATVRLGFLGEVHPRVAQRWDLERTAVFALDLAPLAAAAPETVAYASFGAFPALRQDLAVTLGRDVPADDLLAAVRAAAGATLESVSIFDLYTGAQVGEGRHSLALALSFRAPDRTLTDADVTPVRERIVAVLARIGGELRGG